MILKFKHLKQTIIRLQATEDQNFIINVSEDEFKKSFSMFSKNQISQLKTLNDLRKTEWDAETMAKQLLDKLQESNVNTKTESRFQLRSPYFTGQQAYFTGQQAYFLRRGYSGW